MKTIRIKVPSFKTFRTVTLFVGGLIGVGYETVVEHTDRPTLLVVFTAMMGLPLFLGADEKSQLKIAVTRKDEDPQEKADQQSSGENE